MASRNSPYYAPAQGLRRLPLVVMPVSLLLVSCASTPPVARNPPPPADIVVGSGTDDDRAAIEKTNDQIIQAQAAAGAVSPVSSAPVVNQDVP